MSNYCKECFKKQEQIEQLQAENKELESSLISQTSIIFTLEKSSNDLSQGINKLYQALQEIKEIARNEVETRMLFSDEKSFCDFNNILAKINEVIGAE